MPVCLQHLANSRYAKVDVDRRNDAIGEASVRLLKMLDRYDPKRGRAFSFITRIVQNETMRLLRKEGNYRRRHPLMDEVADQ